MAIVIGSLEAIVQYVRELGAIVIAPWPTSGRSDIYWSRRIFDEVFGTRD